MSADLFEELLARQEVLLFERDSLGGFRLIGTLPDWSSGVLPENAKSGDSIAPGAFFSFLEYFIPEAERFWAGATSGDLRSGLWAETVPEVRRTIVAGKEVTELHLVAKACFAGGKRILFVRRLVEEFDQLESVYQKGRELLLAHERILAETNKKEILLHCIIHDLAGPLAGITGTLQVLEGEELPPQAARFIELAHRAARQQALLIEDLLATFRAETGALDAVDPDPANAPDAIACAREVLDALIPAFASRRIDGVIRVEPGTPDRVLVSGEKGRLERIFHNLIQNALRYSPARGTVTVGFQREDAAVKVTVDDDGSGIPPEVVPTLFQKFVRGGVNRGKSGLGLYFCRISVEQWGGAIGCDPRPEGGTRFWFRLNLV
jgi:hypothetical protein